VTRVTASQASYATPGGLPLPPRTRPYARANPSRAMARHPSQLGRGREKSPA